MDINQITEYIDQELEKVSHKSESKVTTNDGLVMRGYIEDFDQKEKILKFVVYEKSESSPVHNYAIKQEDIKSIGNAN
jgi:hypothetical protein